MKPRKRYLIFLVNSPMTFSSSEVEEAIKRELERCFGERCLALSGIELISYDERTGIGVLRCYHAYLEYARAALALVSDIKGTPIALYTLKVTGTKKKAIRIMHSLNLNKGLIKL